MFVMDCTIDVGHELSFHVSYLVYLVLPAAEAASDEVIGNVSCTHGHGQQMYQSHDSGSIASSCLRSAHETRNFVEQRV